ncbi:Hypothetical protein NTJ_02047 [Nesidiocoris tenuis]|uniref:Uncharacterized protein n=1 Tax=Nesidiocoris tenuis TaxID=355587 RepID=A0ABN7AAF9_9HEMI|nr:Hypothetical protein NTJ_02047 [Nesidiocoris tenuis]
MKEIFTKWIPPDVIKKWKSRGRAGGTSKVFTAFLPRTGSRRGRRGSIGTIGSGKFNEASSLPCSSTGAEAGPAAGSVDRMRGSGHAQLSRSSGKRRGLALDGEKRGGRISGNADRLIRTEKESVD